ncbi:MAG TPA: GNAT family N-acetyltransferase [Ktedonobacterales bacterium]|nr:GNAT family N-acetyltransferase [Ktedonobacterales bacterium]
MIELESERLRLRELSADDLEPMMAVHLSNPDFLSYMEGSEGEAGRYDLERWQRDWTIAQMMPGRHMLGCYLKPQGEAVGFIEFWEEAEDGNPWLGVLSIRKDHHRQGLGSEAFYCLMNYFLKEYNWPSLRAGVLEANEAGMAFAQHLGFQPVEEGLNQFSGGELRYIVFERSLTEA